MVTKNKKENPPHRVLAELYSSARVFMQKAFSQMQKNMRQYLGSDEIDGSETRADMVRNITYELIESQVSANIPYPRIEPSAFSDRREENARTLEQLCSDCISRLPFQEMNDSDERYTYVFGGSVWYIEWEEGAGVKVHSISPESFIPEPGIYSVEDMNYCFIRSVTTRSELFTKYRLSASEVARASLDYEFSGEPMADTVEVVTAFYKDKDGDVGKAVFSGDILLSDRPKYFYKRNEAGEISLHESLTVNGRPAKVSKSVPKRFPIVIRKNTSSAPSLYGDSDCEKIRPQQQAINKVESRILKKLLRAGVTPVMPEGSSVTMTNSIFGQVIKMRPGESLDCYGKIDTTPDVKQDIEEADRLYDMARRILGISDYMTGSESYGETSGVAVQLNITRSISRLESKRRLKYSAYSELYRIIAGYYLAFWNGEIELSYRDAEGCVHNSVFKREDFIEGDEISGYHLCLDYIFTVDLNLGGEYTKESLWEKNLQNLKAGTLGNPEDTKTLLRYWQFQESASYPYARENVKYFKNLIEKEREEN
jgi:hypothetical protein